MGDPRLEYEYDYYHIQEFVTICLWYYAYMRQ